MREAMPMQDGMTIDERRKYVKLMYPRYQKANRQERSRLLTEMEQVTKQHRKHLFVCSMEQVWSARNVGRREVARMEWKWSEWCC
jgi:hypothetical protein